MRATGALIACALCSWRGAASAASFDGGLLSDSGSPLIEIHHKPSHAGGPPWMRRRQGGGWSEERWHDRAYSRRTIDRRAACRTVYRSYYDAYTGEAVRRSARVCD